MNDDWSRCPICYEDYSLAHRPTTFVCGHSTCINHTFGRNRLRECPICRYSLNEQHEYNVSYNLEEASRLYHATKNTIDLYTVQSSPVETQISNASVIHHDKIYRRRFQAEWNGETTNEAATTRPRTVLAFILAAKSRMKTTDHKGGEKKCGHHCFLTKTVQCCSCSDQRPHSENNRYEKYIDGHGIQQCTKRNQYYCPSCKRN